MSIHLSAKLRDLDMGWQRGSAHFLAKHQHRRPLPLLHQVRCDRVLRRQRARAGWTVCATPRLSARAWPLILNITPTLESRPMSPILFFMMCDPWFWWRVTWES